MKRTNFFILTALIFFSRFVSAENFFGDSGFASNPDWEPKPGLVNLYEKSKPSSLEILTLAFNRTHQEIYSQLYDALSSAEITIGDASYCEQGAFAYSFPMSSTIFVCDESGEDYAIRTLIHESVHLTGNMDECEADRLAAFAEIDSGEGLSAPGSYDNQCPDNPKY